LGFRTTINNGQGRKRRNISFYQHATEFTAAAWPAAAAKSRISIIEALAKVTPSSSGTWQAGPTRTSSGTR